MIKKSKILALLIIGALFSGALAISAFTEPTTSPSNTNSAVPINIGKDPQIRGDKLAIGDGATTANSSYLDSNTLYVSNVLGLDALTVRENATFLGNVEVDGIMTVAGALRVPVLYVPASKAQDRANNLSTDYVNYEYNPSSNLTTGIYLEPGTTTNLGRGSCVRVTNTNCPSGYILSKFNPSTGVSSCRKIDPVSNPTSLSSC